MPLFVDINMCSDLWGFVGLCFCSAGIDVVLSIWLSAQHDLQFIHFHNLTTIALHPDSVDDHNTETWKQRQDTQTPDPCIFFALIVSFVFSSHLPQSLSYDTLQSVAMKRQEVSVTVVCSLLTRCLEVKFLLILNAVSLLHEVPKTTRFKSGNKQTTEKREHKNTPKKIFLFC